MKTLLRLMQGSAISEFRPVQDEALTIAIDSPNGNIFEIPTGEGKTPIGMAINLSDASVGRAAYYVVPTKALVDQVHQMFPQQTVVAFGRSEYPCLFYEDKGEKVNAHDSPCYMLNCRHRINMETGEVQEPGVQPCPYFQAKFNALKSQEFGKVTVCTTAFFLTNRLFRRVESEELDEELGDSIVFDEGHNLAKVARGIWEFTLTDFHLKRAETALQRFDTTQAAIVRRFRITFCTLARSKRQNRPYNLLENDETAALTGLLDQFNPRRVEQAIHGAIATGELDPVENRQEIKLLENLIRHIPAFVRSMRYALPEVEDGAIKRHPLNYVVAFCYKQTDPECVGGRKKSRFFLTIRAYYVVPLIRRAIGETAKVTVMSATIGNASIFGHETGLRMPFTSFPSSFDAGNTRIYLPTDTPNLANRKARRDDPKLARKMVLEAAQRFLDRGLRSMIVVTSEDERQRFVEAARKKGVAVITYHEGLKAREAAAKFRSGEGEVLIGTTAQFGEGIDLPRGCAPVIFFLRPGYQRPDDPMTQFEEKRFSQGHCWSLWQYRVMLEALQVRGRNIRTADDVGVCFFVSQQFRSFLYGSLPEWLQPSFVGKKKMTDCVEEALELLGT